jgi:predicted acylesterase/phospholipase RssA
MKLGLFLTSGGARTAYQAGAVEVLLHEGGLHFDVVGCTSVGAINGAFVATGQVDRLVELWSRWRDRDMWGIDWPSLVRGRGLLRYWTQRKGVLARHISEDQLLPGVRYRLNLGCMTTGEQEFFEWPHGPFPLVGGVNGSVAVAGGIKLFEALGMQWCDAGAVDSFALEQLVLNTGVDRVFVVGQAPRTPDSRLCGSVFSIQLRAIEWWQYRETLDGLEQVEAVNSRIREWQARREAAEQAICEATDDAELKSTLLAELDRVYAEANFPYTRPPVEVIPILPERRTDMRFTDYSPARSRRLIDEGREDARKALRSVEVQSNRQDAKSAKYPPRI